MKPLFLMASKTVKHDLAETSDAKIYMNMHRETKEKAEKIRSKTESELRNMHRATLQPPSTRHDQVSFFCDFFRESRLQGELVEQKGGSSRWKGKRKVFGTWCCVGFPLSASWLGDHAVSQ